MASLDNDCSTKQSSMQCSCIPSRVGKGGTGGLITILREHFVVSPLNDSGSETLAIYSWWFWDIFGPTGQLFYI
jgi:hypothetical protein